MTTAPVTLPRELEGHRIAIEDALNAWIPTEFPEDQTYTSAEQGLKLGRVLVEVLHRHLLNAHIAFVYKETLSSHGDKAKLATASRASAKLHYFSDLDFIVEINWTTWRLLTPSQRVALIDHEISHFGVDDKDQWCTLPHDVEEFGSIVRRWGFWKEDLREFGAIAKQIELFPPASPAGA